MSGAAADPAPPSLAGKGAERLGPFVAALHHETEGNPFFIEEVLKHLVEEGAIYPEDAHWQIQPLEAFSVPQSIKVTIGRRLERLSDESRETLALAAVIGQRFTFEVLLQASDLEEERLLDMLDEWLGAHLVSEERQGREELYRFQHALIREVLYDELNLRRKARLHERVGLALEAVSAGVEEEHLEELAHHFAQARSSVAMEKGVDYCLRAGEQAHVLWTNEAAIRHLTAALELLDGLPADEPHLRKRWDVADVLARAYHACHAFAPGQEVLQEYLALAERLGYAWGMAAAHFGKSRQWRAETRALRDRDIETCIQIADQHGLADWRLRARLQLVWFLTLAREELPRAEALVREGLRATEGLPRADVQAAYGSLMHVCAMQGKWDEVAVALRESIPYGGPEHLPRDEMEEALDRMGRRAEFIAFCEEAKALYAAAGLPFPFTQLYLEPAAPSEAFRRLRFRDDFEVSELRPEWHWQNPSRASSYGLMERAGHLTLRDKGFGNLWPGINMEAPRMLLEAAGDFALETKMEGDWDERGERGEWGMSGMLVWKDVLNYIRLDKYTMMWHRGAICLQARTRGEDRIWGRGLLRGSTFHLRLERTGDRFAALCSTDGVHWLTCGDVVFPVKDPLQVGVWAGQGMLVHFDYVQVLGRG